MLGTYCKSGLFCAVILTVLAWDNPGWPLLAAYARAPASEPPGQAGIGGQDARAGLAVDETNEFLPSKSYLMAYESMSTADRLREREMNEDAVALYDEALKLFRQLASDYPMWQTNLVAFRISYCGEELNKTLNLKKPGRDRRNAVDQTASPSRPAESLRSAEPATPAGKTDEFAGEVKEAAGLEQAGDFKGALELYKAVLAQDKENRAALSGAGRCFLRLNMIDEARDILFQWCVIPSPDNSINSLFALILCHDRQYSKAIQLVEIVLNDDNSNAAAHVILGVALAGMGQIDAAISEMQKALELNPRLSEAHYNLAGLMLKKEPGKTSTAAAYYLNALKFGATPDPALAKLLQK